MFVIVVSECAKVMNIYEPVFRQTLYREEYVIKFCITQAHLLDILIEQLGQCG